MNTEMYPLESLNELTRVEKNQQAIERGISYLKNHQYPYGEFCCYYSSEDKMEEWCVPNSTIFPTALIVNSLLSQHNNEDVKAIFKRSISFFQYQTMRGGAMNFFTRWTEYFAINPADVDDTAYVADFFRTQNIEFIDPTPILLANRSKNGLFYTWFALRFNRSLNKDYWLLLLRQLKNPIKSLIYWNRFECSRNDIDAVVNANVLHYLGKCDETEPIIKYLLKIIKEKKEDNCDLWYRNPFTVYYFFSRNVKKGIKELRPAGPHIIERILKHQKKNGCIGDSALETALNITTLINLEYQGMEIENGINFLLYTQNNTGDWPRHILGYSGPNKSIGWGSEELTTGFCIEALAKFQKIQKHGLQKDL